MEQTNDPPPKSSRKWLVYTTLVLAAIFGICATIALRARADVSEHFRRVSGGSSSLNVRFSGLAFDRDSWIVLKFDVGPFELEVQGSGGPSDRFMISTDAVAEWGLRQGHMIQALIN